MAYRLIHRRQKIVSDYVNVHVPTKQSSQIVGRGPFFQYLDSHAYSSVPGPTSQSSDLLRDSDETSVRSKKPLGFSTLGILRHNKTNGIAAFCYENARSDFSSLMGARFISTATAKQPDLRRHDEDKDDLALEKRKEASPEECDQAVAKAKAKAKQLQESRTTFLGFGPALRAVAAMSIWANKLVHWKNRFVSTLKHYWLGSKLLWAGVRISSRLLRKLVGGKSLSRRERQQLTRTTADGFRLVPVAVFIIVPFMEFLLFVFLKVFPNMLPWIYKMTEQEVSKRRLNAKIEKAMFLQETVREMEKEVQNSRSGETKKTAEDLDEFLSKVRIGARVSNEEILGFAKLFNDELTLDNISRPRLVNMCNFMGVNSIGTDTYLRYMLRKRLRSLKSDDKMIQADGVESLSEAKLREDCRKRGMLGVHSMEEMRQQLRDWLDLSLNHSVPSSLLILSRAFTVSGKIRPEAVQATLSSLPDEVVDTVGITSLPSEDPFSERKRKLEFLEMQEELIKEEEKKEEAQLATKKESSMIKSTENETQQEARERAMDKQENLYELCRALTVFASTSSVSREPEEFLRLVNKEIEFYNSKVDQDGTKGRVMKACKAARDESKDGADDHNMVSSALVNKVYAMLRNLEKEIDDVDAKIGDKQIRETDDKVTPEEAAQELIINLCRWKDTC